MAATAGTGAGAGAATWAVPWESSAAAVGWCRVPDPARARVGAGGVRNDYEAATLHAMRSAAERQRRLAAAARGELDEED